MTVQRSTDMGFKGWVGEARPRLSGERFVLIQIKGGRRQGAEAWREHHELAAIPVAPDPVDASQLRRTL
jgi:hypothetical protein